MQKARYVDWTVRFPLNMYAQESGLILNECLTDDIHPSLVGHVFQDVSFLIQDDCNKDAVIVALTETLDEIADRWGLKNTHSYTHHKSTFEVDYQSNGSPTLELP